MAVKPRISDGAVVSKTGKNWEAWFAQLDRAGALDWDHKTIARHLTDSYPLGGWWSQMIAVSYEQARGLRDKHEQADGFQIQRQRNMGVPAARAWQAMRTAAARAKWLPEAKAAKQRSIREDNRLLLRLEWPDGTLVMAGVNPINEGKCSVGVQQSKLPTRADAERAKQYWSARLDALRNQLESD